MRQIQRGDQVVDSRCYHQLQILRENKYGTMVGALTAVRKARYCQQHSHLRSRVKIESRTQNMSQLLPLLEGSESAWLRSISDSDLLQTGAGERVTEWGGSLCARIRHTL